MEISQDLRRRVIWAYENKEGAMRRISKRFSIGLSTMKRLLKLKKETGDLKPRMLLLYKANFCNQWANL